MVAPARFRTLRRWMAPRWLTDGDGGLVGYALDLVADAFVERLRLGHMARFPQQDPTGTPGPADALAALGRDRRVVKGLDESTTSYAARMLSWLDDRKTAGNPFSLMDQLAAYLGPLPMIRTVDSGGNWYTRETDGSRSFLLNELNFDWDGRDETWWSRFWVIIYPNGLWTEGNEWGDAGLDWGDAGQTWGSTATPEQVATVKFLVNDWKPAGTRCINIILAFDPSSFAPTTAYDDPGMPNARWGRWSHTVDGVCVPVRLSTARYWAGV